MGSEKAEAGCIDSALRYIRTSREARAALKSNRKKILDNVLAEEKRRSGLPRFRACEGAVWSVRSLRAAKATTSVLADNRLNGLGLLAIAEPSVRVGHRAEGCVVRVFHPGHHAVLRVEGIEGGLHLQLGLVDLFRGAVILIALGHLQLVRLTYARVTACIDSEVHDHLEGDLAGLLDNEAGRVFDQLKVTHEGRLIGVLDGLGHRVDVKNHLVDVFS